MIFDHPWLLLVAALLAGVCIIAARWRTARLPGLSIATFLIALLLLTLAAGDPLWHRPDRGPIVVLADVSPSTRTANYLDPVHRQLRLRQLLGTQPYKLVTFSSDAQPAGSTDALRERPAAETRLAFPSDAGAIVLFSDGRFQTSGSTTPVYCALDPGLESPVDAAVTSEEIRDDIIAASVRASGPRPRRIIATAPGSSATADVPQGATVQLLRIDRSAPSVRLTIPAIDAWPENNTLAINRPPQVTAQRWWISDRPAPPTFVAMRPADLPTDPAAYLSAGLILLDNIPADSLAGTSSDRLAQYVRELGGTLLIAGGQHAFAAGQYDGTTLDAISPLASSPPAPTLHWLLLTDGSGSMSNPAGEHSRWDMALRSLAAALRTLPTSDLVSIGRFADRIDWWTTGTAVIDAIKLPIPPGTAQPRGPTNLQAALLRITAETGESLPRNLLLLTDGEAELNQPDAIATGLRNANVRLYVLAIGDGKALAALTQIAQSTGGRTIKQFDPAQWARDARRLLQQALPDRWIDTSLRLVIPSVGIDRAASGHNRVWIKPDALALSDGAVPLAARWRAGLGQVVAVAAVIASDDALRLAEPFSMPATDPRLRIAWSFSPTTLVTIDAIEQDAYLNNLPLQLHLGNETFTVPQSAPGRYSLALPAAPEPRIATVFWQDRIINRQAIPGRYPQEFVAIGTDRAALRALADNTGGAIIEPDDPRPIDFHWPVRNVPLAPWLALAGFAFLAAGYLLTR